MKVLNFSTILGENAYYATKKIPAPWHAIWCADQGRTCDSVHGEAGQVK